MNVVVVSSHLIIDELSNNILVSEIFAAISSFSNPVVFELTNAMLDSMCQLRY